MATISGCPKGSNPMANANLFIPLAAALALTPGVALADEGE